MWNIDYSSGTKTVTVTWRPTYPGEPAPDHRAFTGKARNRWGANSTLRLIDRTAQSSGAVIARYFRQING